jgi:hypothetical protein
MAIHFLQSKAARTLSLAQVFRMSEEEAVFGRAKLTLSPKTPYPTTTPIKNAAIAAIARTGATPDPRNDS